MRERMTKEKRVAMEAIEEVLAPEGFSITFEGRSKHAGIWCERNGRRHLYTMRRAHVGSTVPTRNYARQWAQRVLAQHDRLTA